eukprot:scaffold475439_cov56-Prasinocladus_malaysianus.AAC.1
MPDTEFLGVLELFGNDNKFKNIQILVREIRDKYAETIPKKLATARTALKADDQLVLCYLSTLAALYGILEP